MTKLILIALTLTGCTRINGGYVTLKTKSDTEFLVFVKQGKQETFCQVSAHKYYFTNLNEWMECEE
jgi:hypothetical protein